MPLNWKRFFASAVNAKLVVRGEWTRLISRSKGNGCIFIELLTKKEIL
jgi:hypothetical protein